MGDVDDADALCLQVLDHLEQALYFLKGKCTGRLIQNQDLRVSQQSTKKLYQLLLCD